MFTILNRLSIPRRLAALVAAFTLPIGVMLMLIVININSDIQFGTLEQTGNAFQRPLASLLDALAEHRHAGIDRLSGGGADADAAARRVDQALSDLEAAAAAYGEDLQFTAEGLAARQRSHASVATLAGEWRALKSMQGPTVAAFIERHAHLVADVRTMVSHAGDTSNLILDPDLDSYYTMDITLLAVPQAQARLATIVELAQTLAQQGSVSEADRVKVAVLAAALKENDLDRIAADAATALNEDQNFYGASETLKAQLSPAVAAFVANGTALAAALDAVVASAGSPDAVVAAGVTARKSAMTLWTAAAGELDRLLATRAAALRSSRLWAVGLSLAVWVGALAIALVIARSITGPLTDTSTTIAGNARSIRRAADEVSRASQSLSQGATEQAASLEETSASMEEMASMTRQNAEHTQAAASLMAEVDGKVQSSNAALGDMVQSMASIQESSRQVAKIIKTIDEIAFQTNILALNAAGEAARAGEAGMGFAVVADEVRNLAQRSAQAARDTATLIAASLVTADRGNATVEHVAAAIAGITQSVSRVKTLVEEVSQASRQQSQGIDQVSQAIAQMEKVTQTTAATAEESAAASEELSAQAEGSMHVVARLEAMVGSTAARGVAAPTAGVAAPRARVLQLPVSLRKAPERRAEEELPMEASGTFGKF